VVDSALVIVFGGALAAKLYQHFTAPVLVAQPGRHKPGKPVSPAKTEAPPAPVAPPPAAKPAATPATAQLPPARPAPMADAVKRRETPKPQTPGPSMSAQQPATSAPPAATGSQPAENRHSVPIEFKIKASKARSVSLAGAFIVRGGRKEMNQQDDGMWTLTLYLLPGVNYRYWFVVDGKKTLDPDNSKVDRGASSLTLP
jgi:hypothetical protein